MNGKIFEYDKDMKDYVHNFDNDGWESETILYKVMDSHFIKELINTEVEILEDNAEEIEELEYFNIGKAKSTEQTKMIDKINELVKAVNKLRKEKE